MQSALVFFIKKEERGADRRPVCVRKKLSEELKQDVTPYKKKIKMLVIETMQANAAAAPTEAS